MATWMVHFRIADYFLDILDVDSEKFIVGNIGPDCGEGEKDGKGFEPPSIITHWTPSGKKSEIQFDLFCEKHLSDKTDKSTYSFYLGYFIHLFTDLIWSREIYMPTRIKYNDEYEKNPCFTNKIKIDWYDLDHLYLYTNNNFRAFRIFEKIEDFPNKYFEYYKYTAFEKQIKYISDFYNLHSGYREDGYIYLTRSNVDEFVEKAVLEIGIELRRRKLI